MSRVDARFLETDLPTLQKPGDGMPDDNGVRIDFPHGRNAQAASKRDPSPAAPSSAEEGSTL